MLVRNPLLKVLLPLLLACVVIFFGLRILNPRLAHREELRQLVLQKSEELANLQSVAASINDIDVQELEARLAALKNELGLGNYSPEIVHAIEDIADKTGVNIRRYVIQELEEEKGDGEDSETPHQYQLSVEFRSSYLAALDFQKELEDSLPCSEINLTLMSAGAEYRGRVDGVANLVLTTIPQEYEQIEQSSLPLRENPFL